ncbi:MAG: ArsR/SmtB family transcription factor [Chloroflexia bacterium]
MPKTKDPLKQALTWDWGTAYEFLLSIDTVFRPKAHGVPAPWAAGVRKRLSPQGQVDLKAFFSPSYGVLAYAPLHLVMELDPPKDVAKLLNYVEAIPEEDFCRRMWMPVVEENEQSKIMDKALAGMKLASAEVEELRKALGQARLVGGPSLAEVRTLLADMANPAATKKRWLAVMREYHTAFFADEEKRLAPVLQWTLEEAQELSRTMKVTDLIEKISNGFTISEESDLKKLIMVPSLWIAPFVVYLQLADDQMLLAWGANAPGYRLVPGELVPHEPLRVVRALGDPTRLRLMRLLAQEPRTPQALAYELKLSLPTVSHHMAELRGAGLVRFEASIGKRGRENKYTVRWASAERAFEELRQFVAGQREQET